jgi:hypothetical protein
MDSTDLDRIVDKLLVFRGRIPKRGEVPMTNFHIEANKRLIGFIDDLIEHIDLYGSLDLV